jgi:hypothetical protein
MVSEKGLFDLTSLGWSIKIALVLDLACPILEECVVAKGAFHPQRSFWGKWNSTRSKFPASTFGKLRAL